jgi:GT2 family glycosyltransferase
LPSLGAAGCTLLNEDHSVQTSAIQTFPTILNQLLDFDVLRNRFPAWGLWNIAPLFAGSTEPSCVEAISGACVMLRRDVFAQIGQFSRDYFMYSEDIDLCSKAAHAGFINYYLPAGQILHYGGRSSVQRQAVLMRWRSLLRYIAKHRGYPYEFAFRVAMACGAIARLAILAVFVVFGSKARRTFARSALLKWWLILVTMIAHFERPQGAECFAAQRAQGHGD